jgi:hypothetical protein
VAQSPSRSGWWKFQCLIRMKRFENRTRIVAVKNASLFSLAKALPMLIAASIRFNVETPF